MAIKLNDDFIMRMKKFLQEDFEDFFNEYYKEPFKALRVNTLKISTKEFMEISPFKLERVPWCEDGFYFSMSERPGTHIYHDLGVYYIQEPSAMAVVEILDPKPGEKILDISAAPGGKTTHIASKTGNKGLIVANEINSNRVKLLAENLERIGVSNCIITNEIPDKLVEPFIGYFDKVLVDAPCSGEGMFRKDDISRLEWSLNHVISCSIRQKNILKSAAKALKPGGVLVYSTCTFSPEENEGVIQDFLNSNKEFEIIDTKIGYFFDTGHPEWINADKELEKCVRIWPHKQKGEGHFIAKLYKKQDNQNNYKFIKNAKEKKNIDLAPFFYFKDNFMKYDFDNLNIKLFKNHVYSVPMDLPDLSGLKVFRPGWYLGEIKKERFEPSHWLAMVLKPFMVKQTFELPTELRKKYLKGETFELNIKDGWILLSIDGFSAGWGRASKGIIKNYYPKRLRNHKF
ncbi:MAG: RsmF rRNA methyltransferase first C-terminal domain-containing protein [Thermoanaerobacteraceae bacterium]